MREGSLNYERSQNIETAAKLAAELSRAGRHEAAIDICNEARKTGLFEDHPKILLALANVQLAASDHAGAIATLDYLREKNPGFRADGHLVYTSSLEESGATERALKEYEALVKYYPGAEARVRQAMLCKPLGRTEQATELFPALLKMRAGPQALPARQARMDRAREARERLSAATATPS